MSKALELAKGVRALLSEPGSWTKYARGRDRQGNVVGELDHRATCWCLSGAVERVVSGIPGFGTQVIARGIVVNTIRDLARVDMISFNDSPETKHEDVLGVLDRVIEKLEKDESIST